MTHRQPSFAALSLACLTLALGVSGCDSDSPDPDMPEAGASIEDMTDAIEYPADETIDPLGQSCMSWGAAAPCLDSGTAAFCGVYTVDATLEFGSCQDITTLDCLPGDTKMVMAGTCGEIEVECAVWDGVPGWETAECNDGGGETPLVLRFDAAPIVLIDAEATPAASFDIAMAADGDSCITTDWPSAATPWLAVDLDHSGTIDGGHELFGSGSVLDQGKAANGFLALAAYDDNHDGQVDALDSNWDSILVWRDHDGDRQSTPGELETLRDAGIEQLAVHYAVDRRCDARGNCEVERAGFSHAGGRGEIVDLHLACQ